MSIPRQPPSQWTGRASTTEIAKNRDAQANPPYAHTLPHRPKEEWEPLSTPFGVSADQCQRENCQKCRDLAPDHGHLNKVAYWTAKFASEMSAPESGTAKSSDEWGYLAGLFLWITPPRVACTGLKRAHAPTDPNAFLL